MVRYASDEVKKEIFILTTEPPEVLGGMEMFIRQQILGLEERGYTVRVFHRYNSGQATFAGGRWHLCTIGDATHRLGPRGLYANPDRSQQVVKRFVRNVRETVWFGALNWTRPLRHAIGLRKGP